MQEMSYLDLIEMYMESGMNEDDASRTAYSEMFPDKYNPEDWE